MQKSKLTLLERVEIPVGAVVELPVAEDVVVEYGYDQENYAVFYLRKSLALKGVIQLVHTPFPSGYFGKPTIVVKNDHVAPIELNQGDELGELWYFN